LYHKQNQPKPIRVRSELSLSSNQCDSPFSFFLLFLLVFLLLQPQMLSLFSQLSSFSILAPLETGDRHRGGASVIVG
jgi:hypothetical protein